MDDFDDDDHGDADEYDYRQPWQIAQRKAAKSVCGDPDCELSGYRAHAVPCVPCGCPKNHAVDECPLVALAAQLDRAKREAANALQWRKSTASAIAKELGAMSEDDGLRNIKIIVGWFHQADRARVRMREDGSYAYRRTNSPAEIARGGRLLIFWALSRCVEKR